MDLFLHLVVGLLYVQMMTIPVSFLLGLEFFEQVFLSLVKSGTNILVMPQSHSHVFMLTMDVLTGKEFLWSYLVLIRFK